MNKNKKANHPQPTFIIGDEWLYYKFYTGPKTADLVLTEMIKPISEKLLAEKTIDHWFFIRYSDPKLHIRVRFHYSHPEAIGQIIQLVNFYAQEFINNHLIWKIQIDTYQREIERYAPQTMVLAEKLFFHDSTMIVNMLDLLEGDAGEEFRWIFAVRAVDQMLSDFGYDLEKKEELITILRDNFGAEFGINRFLRKQLENKFRNNRAKIAENLDKDNDAGSELKPLWDIIAQKSNGIKDICKEICSYTEKEGAQRSLNDLMGSYLHMMNNRLFKTKQRLHELVLYDFLTRHYKSALARQKYSGKNK